MSILKNIAALLLSLFAVWVLGFAVFAGFAILAPPQEPATKTDAIIVLTGGNNRIHEGLKLFAEKKSKNLFISGVHKDVMMGEITRQWQGSPALPPCCITLGYQATSTTENALETREWIEKNNIKTIRLVTGNYHMTRALLEVRHMLPGIKVYMNPVPQNDLGIETPRFWFLLLVEYHKTLYRSVELLFSQAV